MRAGGLPTGLGRSVGQLFGRVVNEARTPRQLSLPQDRGIRPAVPQSTGVLSVVNILYYEEEKKGEKIK